MESDLDNGETLAGSPLNETEALMEADEDYLEEEEGCRDKLLEGGDFGGTLEEEDENRTKSMDSNDGGGDETSKLINNSGGGGGGGNGGEVGRRESKESGGGGGRAGSSSSISGSQQEPKSPREPFSYAYHFKKKYTFRSDSVYSDVTPMSSAPQKEVVSPKSSESRDKSGSLSSLKGSQSKWVSLKKKLGKINTLSSGKTNKASSSSHASSSDEPSALQQQAASVCAAAAERDRVAAEGAGSSRSGRPIKSLQDKRSLLQRAKTLSILPINSAPKNKERQEKKVTQPPELFNVGGEMNLIPLEMLIDINDIKRPQ